MTDPILRPRRGDLLHAAACLLAILAGGLIVRWGFFRAFPEASIDFRVTGEEAKVIAARALSARGFDLSGMRPLVLFDQDDDAKTYLERTLGLARASEEFGTRVPVWRWSVRFVRPLEKLEYAVHVAPSGEVTAWRRLLPEKAPAADPGDPGGRRIAEAAFRDVFGKEPSGPGMKFVEATAERRPSRVDRTFVFESLEVRHGDGALRYLVELQGDQVGRCVRFYKVPEKWSEEYRLLRSKNGATGSVATLALFLTGLAVVAVVVERIRRRDVRWGTALAFGGAGFVLQLAASLNELPVSLFDYATSDGWGSAVARSVLGSVGGAVTLAVLLILLVAAGEPLTRETFPKAPALGRIFSLRALGTRSVFRGLLLGYALTALFFAYQVLFYVGADRLGAWAPAEVPYSNLLGTRFPWLAVLLAGFVPATTEEFLCRMFSIPFLRRFSPMWVAVVVPAFVWGFAHASYPNQPFWIRGVEVGLAGIVIGVVFVRAGVFPLLVWHFTVDAAYTALILIRSTNRSFAISGAVAAGALLLPLVASALLLLRRRGFAPEEGLSNESVGSAPPLPHAVERDDAPPPVVRSGRTLALAAASAVVLLLLARFVLPRFDYGRGEELRIDRTEARRHADAFVRAAGDDPGRYLSAAFHASALPALESPGDTGASLLPYGYSGEAERWLIDRGGTALLSRWAFGSLPGRVWQVRYLRFGDRHGWWVVVDGRNGKVVSFQRTFPEEEAGARLDEPSARARGEELLRSAGLDPSRLSVVSFRSEERKGRRDARIVYEAPDDSAGEARLRVTVGLAGEESALLTRALKLPEEWVRQRDRATPVTYTGLAWKVGGLGILLGLVVVELFHLARAGALAWRRALRAAACWTMPGLASLAVSFPESLRNADGSGMSLATFSVAASVGFVFRILLTFSAAFVASLLVLVIRPDAFSPRRWVRSGGGAATAVGAVMAAAAAVLLLWAGRQLGASIEAVWPGPVGLGAFPGPPAIDALLPAVAALAGAARMALFAAGFAAALALLRRRFFTAWPSRLAGALCLAGLLVPLSPRSAADLLVPLLAALPLAVALLAAFHLLGDDPRAWWMAGIGATLVPAGIKLAASGVASWSWNGAALLALAAGGVIWVAAIGPEQPTDGAAEAPGAED
jgi:membrane protease YdiL (CAAX protease family)